MIPSNLISVFVFCFALQTACYPRSEGSDRFSCSQNSFTVVSDDNGIWPYREYKSSNATPPQFLVRQKGKVQRKQEELIFLTVEDVGLLGYAGVKQQRALMMSPEGDLVWAGPQGNTSNFRSQELHEKPVITYWTGAGAAASSGGAAHGYGTVEILNTKYETIYSICPKLNITFPPGTQYPCVADVHESYITPDNTILVTVYNITQADLSSVGGPKDGWVYDPLAVEVDLESNEPIFIWDPLQHVHIASSHIELMDAGQNASNPYDWFHMNSIQSHNGHFLINSRQTWAAYYVNRHGHIVWQIDGENGGDFGSLPPNGHFSWQHDVRIQDSKDSKDNQVILTLFGDNNGNPMTHKPSVGLGLALDLPPNKANPPRIHTHLVDPQDRVYAYAEGSYMTLENGNAFVGYGVRPVFKEFGRDSATGADVVLSVQFGYVNDNNTASSYRAFKQEWHATPSSTRPSLLVRKSGSRDILGRCAGGSDKRAYVSWNGATDVSGYTVYTGDSNHDLRKIGEVVKAGFETEFVVPEGAKYMAVAAIEEGKEVGRSQVVET